MQLTALSLALTRIGLGGFGVGSSLNLDFTSGNRTLDPRITFSRASNATVTGPDGVLGYAPHNLLTFSEQFDNAAWLKTNATVTANAAVAPDGSTTADLFLGTGSGAHYAYAPYTVSAGVAFTLSCYVKNFTLTGAAIVWLRDFTEAGIASFSLATGTVNTTSGIASEAAIVDVGNGWYRISAKFTPTTSGTHNVSPTHIATGSTTTGFYAWGAQLNVGPLQPYYPTTVKNLLGYTQEFDNAAWIKVNGSITANATTAPDGSMTADKLVENTAASVVHFASQTPAAFVAGTTYVFSTYAKKSDTSRYLQLVLPSGAFTSNIRATFDLDTGAVVSSGGVSANATNVGSGWYRCTFTATATTSATAGIVLAIANTFAANLAAVSYTGDGTSGIYIWGAQLSDSASLDPYVYNPGAAPAAAAYYGPRFDYDPVTLAPRGLLIEEQRTNSIRNNTMQGAVAGTPGTLPTNWATTPFPINGLSQTIAGIGSENGIAYMDIRISGVTTAGGATVLYFDSATTTATAAPSQAWSTSAYFKVAAGSTLNILTLDLTLRENDSATAFLRQTLFSCISAGSVLTRYSGSATTGVSTAFVNTGLRFSYNTGAAIDITLRIGMPQLELGAFATSVIPTSGAAATRAADVAVMTGANFLNWYRQDEGTLFAEFSTNWTGQTGGTVANPGVFCLTDIASAVFNGYGSRLAMNGPAPIRWGSRNGASTSEITAAFSGFLQAGTVYKSAYALAPNALAQAVNGGAAVSATDANYGLMTINRLEIGFQRVGGTNTPINGHIRKIAYFPRRLSNAELQGITS